MRNTTQAEPLNPIHHVNGKVYRFVKEVKFIVPNIVINQIYRTLYKGRWKEVSTNKGNEVHRQIKNQN